MIAIGAHTSNADPLGEAEARGADLVQVFLSNPQSWRKPKPRADAARLREASTPLYVHAPYLVNVVADNSRVRIPSRRILQETCDAAADVGARAVVVHGGHVTGEGSEVGTAFARWRKALEELDTDVPVLIENTAGGDNAVARRVETIARLWQEIGDLGAGLVLDTCHAWAGGEPLDEVVGRMREAAGRIDLIHCNDSRDGFDSRRDRHAALGCGEIPPELIVRVVREAGVPVVVETPGDAEGQAKDIAWLRERLGD